jgi:hypothetical protein
MPADTHVEPLNNGYQNRILYAVVSFVDELGIIDNPAKFMMLNVLLMLNEIIYRATYEDESYENTITLNLLFMLSSIYLINIAAQFDNAINDSVPVPMLIDRSAAKREVYAGIYTDLFPAMSRFPGPDINLRFTLIENTNKIVVLAIMMEWNRIFVLLEMGMPIIPALTLEAYIKTFTLLALNFASHIDNTFCEMEPALTARNLQRRQTNNRLFCRFFSGGNSELYAAPDTRNMTAEELDTLAKDSTKKIRGEMVKQIRNMFRM